MPRALPVAVLAAAIAVVAGSAAPGLAQDQPRQPTRLTMSLEKVLPLLNTAVVRVRTPGGAPAGAGVDTVAKTADGGAAKPVGEATVTHLTGIRVGDDLAIVAVPDVDPAPDSYDVALYDGWLPATIVAKDESGLYALLRIGGQRETAPSLAAAPVAPGFVVGAVSVGATLNIKTVWLEPGEKIDLPAGAAVWAVDGRFAGLTSAVDGGTIIIPGADVLANADELRAKVKPAVAR